LSKWTGDPWTVRVENNKIYGRGAEDNQQGIVTSLLTAKAFVEENCRPQHDLALLFVSDEETGNEYGIQHILKNHRDLFTKDDFIIIPDSGNASGTIVEVAEKSILWIKFEILGKQTHGSTPELGINAARAGAALITSLDQLYKKFDTVEPVFDPPVSTFEPTKKEANVPNVNTIPGHDVFYYDCRILPTYDLSEIKSFVQRIAGEIQGKFKVKVNISFPYEFSAAPPTPTGAPVVNSLIAAIAEIKKVKPKAMGIGGGTVAAFFRQANFNAVVWATQDETLHSPDEYAKTDNILDDAKVFAHVLLQR
jgi:succinyl-diaminopimelate desuccinylase